MSSSAYGNNIILALFKKYQKNSFKNDKYFNEEE
jgi:hypothetical protein